MINSLKSRKLILAVAVFILTSVFLWFAKIDMGVWERITMVSIGGYMATNAITKFAKVK